VRTLVGETPTGAVSYIAKRMLLLVPVFLGVTFVSFVVSFVITPDVTRVWTGGRPSPAAREALVARYHLKEPIWVQYYYYLVNFLTGNWGIVPSTGRSVASDIQLFFPATVELALAAIILVLVIGISLGIVASIYHDRKIDHSIRLFYLAGYSSPPFLVALLVLLVFAYTLRVFPTQGRLSSSLMPPYHITGLYMLDSLLTGNWPVFQDALWHVVLPATALALTYFGVITRVTRASMLEVFNKEFITASYAKGLSRRSVIYKHALRNAMIPITTISGLMLGFLLGGAVVVETIFQWPGIGYYAVRSILTYDFPSVFGVTALFTIAVVVSNLVADILYAFLDPRIKI
jgi:peptide/nickel transport system permease protein